MPKDEAEVVQGSGSKKRRKATNGAAMQPADFDPIKVTGPGNCFSQLAAGTATTTKMCRLERWALNKEAAHNLSRAGPL